MDRRTAIRKALGVGAVAASLPVLSKLAEASPEGGVGCATGYNIGPPTAVQPPPMDTRTPEQVLEDADKASVRDIIRHLTQEPGPWSRRYVWPVWSRDFDMAVAALHAQRIVVEARKINGTDCLIGTNGNVIRRINPVVVVKKNDSVFTISAL